MEYTAHHKRDTRRGGFLGAVYLLGMTARRGPPFRSRPAFWGVLPFVIGTFIVLGVAGCVNIVSV